MIEGMTIKKLKQPVPTTYEARLGREVLGSLQLNGDDQVIGMSTMPKWRRQGVMSALYTFAKNDGHYPKANPEAASKEQNEFRKAWEAKK